MGYFFDDWIMRGVGQEQVIHHNDLQKEAREFQKLLNKIALNRRIRY
jgi:hypothetical protein